MLWLGDCSGSYVPLIKFCIKYCTLKFGATLLIVFKRNSMGSFSIQSRCAYHLYDTIEACKYVLCSIVTFYIIISCVPRDEISTGVIMFCILPEARLFNGIHS